MSSFFSSLISRSLAPEAQIAPRPVARFEPAGPALPPDSPAELEEQHVFQTAARPRQEAPARASTAPESRADAPAGDAAAAQPAGLPAVARVPAPPEPRPPAERQAPREAVSLVAEAVAVARPAQGSVPPPSTAAAPPAALLQTVDLPPRAARPADARPVSAREHRPHDSGLAHVQPAARAQAQPTQEWPAPPLAGQRAPAVPAVAPRPPEAARPAQHPDAARPEPLRPAPLIQPEIAPARPRDAAPRQEAEPGPAPVIQVTIGRIEVRAAPAPTRPERPRAAPAAMTLDEYLRKRSNGGSR